MFTKKFFIGTISSHQKKLSTSKSVQLEMISEKTIINITVDLNSNLVGVGGVFEWVAGTKKKAPEWLANLGMEWFLRLIQDPKRLYKRYLIDNSLFIFYFLRQVLLGK